MGTKKQLEDERARVIKNLRSLIKHSSSADKDLLRRLSRRVDSVKNDTRVGIRDSINRDVAAMIRDLYFISGTSSGSEEYMHMVGEDAFILKSIKEDMSNDIPISKEQRKKLYSIYKKLFPRKSNRFKYISI